VTQNEPAEPAPVADASPGGRPPEAGTTGDPQVDEALHKLAGLDGLPLHEHPGVFEQIHGALAGALGTLGSGVPDPGTGPARPAPAAHGPATPGQLTP
jgi:hypothetical protein